MAEETQTPAAAEVVPANKVVEEEEPKEEEPKKEVEVVMPQSGSFKEESNVVADLIDPEKKALEELKLLLIDALAKREFSKPPPPPPKLEEEEEEEPKKTEEPSKEEEEPKKAEEELKKEEPKKPEEETKKVEEPKKPEEELKKEEPKKPEEEAKKVEEPKKPEEEEAKKVEEPKKPEEEAKKVEEPKKSEPSKPEEPKQGESSKPITLEEAITETTEPTTETTEPTESPEEVFIWGIPLVGDEKSDTILLKFLRARDFKAKDALTMIKNTVLWRKEFGIEELLNEELDVPEELQKAVFMHGVDKEGHPVCYNVYGEFQDKELYQKAFGDEEKRKNFLRWRVQVLEKGIRELLDFNPDGICTMVQVTDLKNSPGPMKKELRQATNQALALLQDNYPEFAAKQVFINVPWWYLAFNRMISPFLTQRSKSKFVFAGPSKSAETLFKYIAPEQVPVQYGGVCVEKDADFTTSDAVMDAIVKPSSKHTIEIPVSETCLVVWELRVLGWDVTYGAEFVPQVEGGYTVIVQKARKFASTDEPVIKNIFKVGEAGKIVLTIDNATTKKKKLLYRSKTKSSTDSM